MIFQKANYFLLLREKTVNFLTCRGEGDKINKVKAKTERKGKSSMARPFDYTAEYNRKLTTPDEAARVVKSGDWIDIAMGTGFPSLMDAAIAKRKDELREVKIRGYLIFEPIQMVECDPERKHFVYNSWHMSGYERKLCDRGLCNFNPMVFRNLGWYYSQFLTVNVRNWL